MSRICRVSSLSPVLRVPSRSPFHLAFRLPSPLYLDKDDKNEPPVLRVRVVAESRDVISTLIECVSLLPPGPYDLPPPSHLSPQILNRPCQWGHYGPPTEAASRQRTLTVNETTLLVRAQASYHRRPTYTTSGRWDPTRLLAGADAVLFAYRAEDPETLDFIEAFAKSLRPRGVLRGVPTGVVCVGGGSHKEEDGRTRGLAGKVGAVDTYMVSGGGSPEGFHEVVEAFVRTFGEGFASRAPGPVVPAEGPRVARWWPSLLRRLFFWRVD